jgi:hypothetical protein
MEGEELFEIKRGTAMSTLERLQEGFEFNPGMRQGASAEIPG